MKLGILSSRSEKLVVLMCDDEYVVLATPNGSMGYLYVTCLRTEEAPTVDEAFQLWNEMNGVL